MAIFKVAILSSLAISSLFAKIDFVKFGDICNKNSIKNCKNSSLEIKAVQYLLKKRLNPEVEITGKLDKLTNDTIIALQLKEHIPASGYIGKNTKDALNKLLYGHRLHKKEVTPQLKEQKDIKSVAKIPSKVKVNYKKIIPKIVAKKTPKTIITPKVSKRDNVKKVIAKKGNFKSYRDFRQGTDLKKSYAVYKNIKLLKMAGGRNTLLKVDVSEQRVKLVVNGKVALDAPCTTGSKHKLEPNTRTYRDKRTPLGTFKIMEKIATKRSTIFGNLYRNGKLIYHGDRRKYKGSWSGIKFVGAPLKNWMRLTSSGIGLHASSHVKRYPGSNGCIRLQPKVAITLFKKIKPGTTVKVVN